MSINTEVRGIFGKETVMTQSSLSQDIAGDILRQIYGLFVENEHNSKTVVSHIKSYKTGIEEMREDVSAMVEERLRGNDDKFRAILKEIDPHGEEFARLSEGKDFMNTNEFFKITNAMIVSKVQDDVIKTVTNAIDKAVAHLSKP